MGEPQILRYLTSLVTDKPVVGQYSVVFPPVIKTSQNYIRTTKYSLLTFIPLNLMQQFKRAYNIYFLLGCFSLIGGYASVSSTSMVAPLIIVLAFSAAKEAVEDFNRYRADVKANTTPCCVVRNEKRIIIESMNVCPGDILYLEKGGKFCVDVVLISSSWEDGSVFVETAELDGETNLKRKASIGIFAFANNVEAFKKFNGVVECEQPNENLLTFQGRVTCTEPAECVGLAPLTMMNMAPRGAVLRNTEWVYGLVVYTGLNTKIIRNLKPGVVKVSSLTLQLNRLVVAAFILNMVILGISVGLQYVIYSDFISQQNINIAKGVIAYGSPWYIGPQNPSSSFQILQTFLSFFALYTYIIPISLFVTIELARLAQAAYMTKDDQMMYTRENSDGTFESVPMRASNSNLNEELGKVDFIFSDKTGTFTQNSMVLAKWYVGGTILDEMESPGSLFAKLKTVSGKELETFQRFAETLSICHGVIPAWEEKKSQFIYESQSPDETALLIAIRSNNYKLIKRSKKSIVVDIDGIEVDFEVLDTVEFDSTRKRMTTVVRTANGIMCYSKGADNVMFERLGKHNKVDIIDQAKSKLIELSEIGLRTLVMGCKKLTEKEYTEFKIKWDNAQVSLNDRELQMALAAATLECDFTYLGCTAIEDKLQDRVPETIEYLLRAGIRLWLLTGDKQETAINIGMSSRLITAQMSLFILSGDTLEECNARMKEIAGLMSAAPDKVYALVVDGHVLEHVFNGESKVFLEIGTKCKSVICSRATPLQKAKVVALVKRNLPKAITLAIGDGANDVSMIQEAHIGVGIMGKEGTQAVRAADYSFGEFKFLERLISVHGRYNLLRMSNVILYSFYKNLVFILIQFLFGFFSAWSGQLVYEELFFTAFNVVFTSFPPLWHAIFERDINDELIKKNPEIYKEVRAGLYFSPAKITFWLILSFCHAFIIFGSVYLTNFDGSADPLGYSTGYWVQSYLFSTPMLLTITLKLMVKTRFFVWPIPLFVFLSILMNLVIMFLLMVLDAYYYTDYATAAIIHALPGYYMLSFVMPAVCLVPDFVCSL